MDKKEVALALLDEGYTCAIVREGETLCSKLRGVAPLLAWLQEGQVCKNGIAADKVVGKAAAYLYVLLGVDEVHALVMSKEAENVFLRFGIAYSYRQLVSMIRNRTGDGYCPMEQAVLSIDKPIEGVQAIKETLAKLKEKAK